MYFSNVEALSGLGLLSPDAVRADKLREVLSRLYEYNIGIPIVVEGRKDIAALRKLGFHGELIALHSFRGFYDFSEAMHERYEKLVLLLDWDEKGDALQSQVGELLKGLWEDAAPLRESLRNLCQKDIQDIQSLPTLMERIAGTNDVVFSNSEGG